MRISYDKLWHLIEKNKMNKSELAAAAEISEYTMTKMNKDEPVSLEVIMKICKILHCNVDDIVEMIQYETAGLKNTDAWFK